MWSGGEVRKLASSRLQVGAPSHLHADCKSALPAAAMPSASWCAQPALCRLSHSCRVQVGAAALIIPLLEDFVDHFLGEYAGDGAGAF